MSGKGSHGSRWYLYSRDLEFVFPRPLRVARGALTVQCGDLVAQEDLADSGPTWAEEVQARVHTSGTLRRVRVMFARDIAERVNYCWAYDQNHDAVSAPMAPEDGVAPACAPDGSERVVAQSQWALVTDVNPDRAVGAGV
jgi:hypothetical protein